MPLRAIGPHRVFHRDGALHQSNGGNKELKTKFSRPTPPVAREILESKSKFSTLLGRHSIARSGSAHAPKCKGPCLHWCHAAAGCQPTPRIPPRQPFPKQAVSRPASSSPCGPWPKAPIHTPGTMKFRIQKQISWRLSPSPLPFSEATGHALRPESFSRSCGNLELKTKFSRPPWPTAPPPPARKFRIRK